MYFGFDFLTEAVIFIFKEYFVKLTETFKAQLNSFSFGVNDFFDILLVAVLLYYVYKFIRDKRAGKLAFGLLLLLLLRVISDIFSLSAMSFIISNFFQIGLLAIVIIFQPEFRSVLEKAGGNSIKGFKALGEKHSQSTEQMIVAVCDAACEMAKEKTGALIVFENETGLGDVIASGTVINADISSFLIRNIFFENTPLHDGALVIRNERIHAAGCFLPLSEDVSIAKELGTRHRAAIGMSEVSDALVLVVSEETGVISVAENGVLRRNFDYASLRKALTSFFSTEEEGNTKKRFVRFPKREKNDKNGGNKNAKKKDDTRTKDDIAFDLFDGEGRS